MICVTIGRGRNRTLLEEWKEAADAGAELVELRIDCLRSEPDLKRILAQRFTPLVFTIRRGADGGLWRGDEEKRSASSARRSSAGVDYVDLEADIAAKIPRYGKTKRIVSIHDMKKTAENLEEIAKGAREANADIVKVATMAHSWPTPPGPAAGGQGAGPHRRHRHGAAGGLHPRPGHEVRRPADLRRLQPRTHLRAGHAHAPGLTRDYHHDKIDAGSEVYAVLGDPIGHSLSPALHNAAFRHLGLNKVYVPLQIPAGALKEGWPPWPGWTSRATASRSRTRRPSSPCCQEGRRGGADRLVQHGRGPRRAWTGANTDYRAAIDTLEGALGGPVAGGESPCATSSADPGGRGRGPVDRLRPGPPRRGGLLCNRNDEKAAKLAGEAGCRHISWAMRAGTPCDILINCTPVGMHPNLDDSPVPPAAFRAGMLVFDTVYHPQNTLLLKLARERDCRTASGADMFLRQAALQFELFTGKDAPRRRHAAGRRAQARGAARMNPDPSGRRGLALVGARGTGKTSVGRIVAAASDCRSPTPTRNSSGGPAFDRRDLRRAGGAGLPRPGGGGPGADLTARAELGAGDRGRGGPPRGQPAGAAAVRLVVWLTAEPDVLAGRLGRDAGGRPALTAAGLLAEVAAVLEARTPLYREVADATVETAGRTPAEVADAVLDAWSRSHPREPPAVTTAFLVILGTLLFVAGTAIGSFLNVCIHRIPWQKSIIWPHSCCPKCLHTIAARDNVPIVGWLALRGRCRHCGLPISVRYPSIEGLVGLCSSAPSWPTWRRGPDLLHAGVLAEALARLAYHLVLIGLLVGRDVHRLRPVHHPRRGHGAGHGPGRGAGGVGAGGPPRPVGGRADGRRDARGRVVDGGAGAAGRRRAGLGRPDRRRQGLRPRGDGLRRRDAGGDDRLVPGLAGGGPDVLPVPVLRLPHALGKVIALVIKRLRGRQSTGADREIPFGPYLSLAATVLVLGWPWIWWGWARDLFRQFSFSVVFWYMAGQDGDSGARAVAPQPGPAPPTGARPRKGVGHGFALQASAVPDPQFSGLYRYLIAAALGLGLLSGSSGAITTR
jgi:3-dehydroquinate dehydratase/shikimate dehydrogenase